MLQKDKCAKRVDEESRQRKECICCFPLSISLSLLTMKSVFSSVKYYLNTFFSSISPGEFVARRIKKSSERETNKSRKSGNIREKKKFDKLFFFSFFLFFLTQILEKIKTNQTLRLVWLRIKERKASSFAVILLEARPKRQGNTRQVEKELFEKVGF